MNTLFFTSFEDLHLAPQDDLIFFLLHSPTRFQHRAKPTANETMRCSFGRNISRVNRGMGREGLALVRDGTCRKVGRRAWAVQSHSTLAEWCGNKDRSG